MADYTTTHKESVYGHVVVGMSISGGLRAIATKAPAAAPYLQTAMKGVGITYAGATAVQTSMQLPGEKESFLQVK